MCSHARLVSRLHQRLRNSGGTPARLAFAQQLEGIGPFYAGLIVLRATGFADAVLPTAEPKVLRNTAELYGLPQPPTLERFIELADHWRPFRTWATVLIRLAGDRARRGT